MIEGVPEVKKQLNISVGALIGACVFCFLLGGVYVGMVGLDSKIEDEVGGLRSDWERWKEEQYYPDIKEVNKDVDEIRKK